MKTRNENVIAFAKSLSLNPEEDIKLSKQLTAVENHSDRGRKFKYYDNA